MSRSVRNITACRSCRSKKIRCDKKFPQCSNCSKKGIECVSIDPGTGEVIGRSYVFELEKEIETLKEEIRLLKLKPTASFKSDAETIHNNSTLNGSSNGYINYKVLLLDNEEVSKLKALPEDELPPITLVQTCLSLFFKVCNIQLPILHRDFYLINYYKPLYGRINFKVWYDLLDISDIPPVNTSDLHTNCSPKHKKKCLFFLYIILAILTSVMQQKYPLSLSHYYQQQSLKYADSIWNFHGTDLEDDIAKLEMIQSLLLLSVYSIMRPSNPGAWYLIGNSIRLMYDLNLHEEPDLLTDDQYLIEMRRRMFWSCYSLDRQISLYFRKPFGIILKFNIKLPFAVDDSFILGTHIKKEDIFQNESYSKMVTIHYIKLRVLQDDILSVTANSDRVQLEKKLNEWYLESKLLKTREFYEFNQLIFELNFHQSVISLYRHLLFNLNIGLERKEEFPEKIDQLFNASKRIVQIYYSLQNNLKLLNYSWVSINNIFLSNITFLYIIYYIDRIRSSISIEEITELTDLSISFLNNLKLICFNQCEICIKNIVTLKSNVIDLINNERLLDLNLDDLFDNTEFINSMVGSVNSLEFDFLNW